VKVTDNGKDWGLLQREINCDRESSWLRPFVGLVWPLKTGIKFRFCQKKLFIFLTAFNLNKLEASSNLTRAWSCPGACIKISSPCVRVKQISLKFLLKFDFFSLIWFQISLVNFIITEKILYTDKHASLMQIWESKSAVGCKRSANSGRHYKRATIVKTVVKVMPQFGGSL